MAKNNDSALFPINADPFGVGTGSNDLFANEKLITPPASSTQFGQTLVNQAMKRAARPPTKAELAAQAEAERAQHISSIAEQIGQMRTDPQWLDASLDRRKQLYKSWLDNTYRPALKGVADAGLRGELLRLPGTILEPDITNLEKAIKSASRLGDVWEGAKASGNQMLQGFGDYAPAAFNQARIDYLSSMLEQDGKPLVIDGVAQIGFDGKPTINTLTPKRRREIEQQIVGLQKGIAQQFKDAAVSDKAIAANLAAQSIGQANRNAELQEDIAKYKESFGEELGAFAGYIANAAVNPSNALQMAAENAPSMVPAIIASGVGGPVGAAAAGGVLSGQDALSSAIQQVRALPEETLLTLPEYNALRETMDEESARNTLALRAGKSGALLGTLVGMATGPMGVEAGAGKLLSRAASGAVTDLAGKSTGRVLAGAVAKGAGRTALEGVEEGGTQIAANLGQMIGTGGDNNLLEGVGESVAQGIIAGAPLGGGSEAVSAIRDIRNRPDGVTRNDTTTQTDEGQITDIPTAAQAAAEQQGQASPVSPVADQAAVTEAITTLRATFDDMRSRAGQAITEGEYGALMQQLHSAEAAGINMTAIQAGLDGLNQVRSLPDGHPSDSLFAAYQSYVNERTQADAGAVAAAVDNSFATGDFINGRTDAAFPGADYTGVAIRANLNSEMAATGPTNRTATPAIYEDVGGINTAPETAGASWAQRNDATTNEGNTAADAAVGDLTSTTTADSRPDNQPIPDAGQAVSAGERGGAGSAGQRAADGGSTAGVSGSTARGDVSVGDTVTYVPPFPGAMEMTGTVTGVAPNGTFSLTISREGVTDTYGNLPVNNIRREAPPAQALGAAEMGSQEQVVGGAPAQVAEVEAGAVTPGGRDTQRLDVLADRLLTTDDGTYAADAIELSAALERGDKVKADIIADYLYSQGMRQFKPATINTGLGRASIESAYNTDLNGAERLALQREFEMARNDLPAELSTFSAFRDAMVHDSILTDSGTAPLTSVFERLSQTARDIVSKIAKALATVLFAITLSNTFPINDAVAATGTGTVTTVTRTQGMSEASSTVNSWVREIKDNAGQKYIIADKASGEIHIMDSRGNVLATAPALYGAKVGDGMSVGETPAGIFTLQQEAAPASYGGDIQSFADAPNGDIYAIHRVLTTNPKQNRQGRLASKTADDNRVSLGCINIPVDTYNQYLASGFRGKLYIIPDQKELGAVFKGIDEIQAKMQLTENSVLPQDMSDQTAAVFESSTDVVAESDPTSLSALAVLAEDANYGIATSDAAAKSNFPADNNDAGAALFMAMGLFGVGRVRRRQDSPRADADTAGDPVVTKRTVAQANFHSISDESTVDTASGRPATNQRTVQSATATMIERLSDADHRFIQWTDSAGMVGDAADYNSAPLVQSLKRIEGTRNNLLEEARAKYIKPLERTIRSASARLGVSPDVVARDLGTWTTLAHIPEDNARMRREMVLARDEAMFTADAATYNAAEETLRAFDAYQAGTGPRVATGGGFTDNQAMVKQQQIEGYGYSQEELRGFQQHIVTSIPKITEDLVLAGVLTQEEVNSWPKYNSYVPLYVVHEQAGGDVYLGAGEFTTGKTYRREGAAEHYASHAYVTFQQYIFRAASAQASAEFRYGLHKAYQQLNDAGDTHGLQRVNMASAFIPQEAKDATGIFYRESDFDSDGNLVPTTYKYFFTDPRIMDGLRTKNAEPSWGALKLIANGTRGYGMLVTVARPLFPPILWVKDAYEKVTSLSSRYIYDAKGKLLSSAHTALRVGLSTLNPINVAALAMAQITGDRSSPIVKALDELKALGGLSVYQQMLSTSTKNMRAELKSLRGWRRIPKGVMAALTSWNNIWAESTSAAAYMALRNMGVTPEQAAFSVLDTFNVYNRGLWKNTAQSLYPFVGSAAEGGRNLVMNLSNERGRKVFIAQVLLGISLYALLSAMAPDDDDRGNMLDATNLNMLGNSIPIYSPDGSSIRVPMGFGSAKLAWLLGAGAHRMANGVDTIGDVASTALLTLINEMQPLDAQTAANADGLVSGLISAITPTLLAPVMQVERNMNAFGGRIYGSASQEGFKSDAARATTPQVWTDIAQTMRRLTGVDTYPESIRHIATSYLVGPLAAITTAMEADSLYTRGGHLTTKQELGPVGVAFGIQSLWDNGNSGVPRAYFEMQDAASGIMRRHRVSASEAGTKPGQKAFGAGNRILEAGGSLEDALLVQYAVQAETDRQRMNTQMKAKANAMKRGGGDLQLLSPEFEVHAQEQERLMREFIRSARGLK